MKINTGTQLTFAPTDSLTMNAGEVVIYRISNKSRLSYKIIIEKDGEASVSEQSFSSLKKAVEARNELAHSLSKGKAVPFAGLMRWTEKGKVTDFSILQQDKNITPLTHNKNITFSHETITFNYNAAANKLSSSHNP